MINLHFDFKELISAFLVLFAVIDIAGLIPVIIDLKMRGVGIQAGKASIYSFFTFIFFLFAGSMVLQLFGVDIPSFAVAGALVIFVIALEMIFGLEIFKMDGPSGSATIVPLVFPLIAGAGSFTALLSLRAEYNLLNIILALFINCALIYIVIRFISKIERMLGKGGVYVLRKLFGIILLAISVKLFTTHLATIINGLNP